MTERMNAKEIAQALNNAILADDKKAAIELAAQVIADIGLIADATQRIAGALETELELIKQEERGEPLIKSRDSH